MSQHRRSIAPEIQDQAAEWFVIMREPSVSAEDRAAFADWLRASPVHAGAYLDMARLWVDAGQIAATVEVSSAVGEPDNVVLLGNASARRPESSTGRSRRLAWAAGFLVALVGGSALWLMTRAPTYSTEIGEQRVVTLDDGSTMSLNSRSRVEVRMSRGAREIELREGQALFDVAHDSARPFIVRAGDVAIKAVGTQFDVNRRRSVTVVTVVEGRVVVDGGGKPAAPSASHETRATDAQAASSSDPAYASAGEQLTVGATGAINRVKNANASAAIGWLQQELVFDGQPLSEVLEEFNRYSRVPIVLEDPSLAGERISGVFHTKHPDALLKFISRLQGVQVEQTDKEIRISRQR